MCALTLRHLEVKLRVSWISPDKKVHIQLVIRRWEFDEENCKMSGSWFLGTRSSESWFCLWFSLCSLTDTLILVRYIFLLISLLLNIFNCDRIHEYNRAYHVKSHSLCLISVFMILEVIVLLKVLFKKRTQSATGMMPCFGYKPILKAYFYAVVLIDTISGQGKENTTYCKWAQQSYSFCF